MEDGRQHENIKDRVQNKSLGQNAKQEYGMTT